MTEPVAPFESCTVCMRGDTTTAFMVHGEAEVVMAFIQFKLGLPTDQAIGTVLAFARDDLGCTPGMVPDGERDHCVRLCKDCAKRLGVKVGRLPGPLPVYGPPQEEHR